MKRERRRRVINAMGRMSKWPSRVPGNRLEPEAWPQMTPSFQIKPGQKIFGIGSCFARNFEQHIRNFGFELPMLGINVPKNEWSGPRPNGILNKYTPAGIFQEIAWTHCVLKDGAKVQPKHLDPILFHLDDGRVVDTQLAGSVPVSHARAVERRKQIFDVFREVFESDVVVITLGLIEAWKDTKTGLFIQQVPIRKMLSDPNRFTFQVLGHAECMRYVLASIDLIANTGKKNKNFLLTTSPVPLLRTFTTDDVLIANMHSKSVLRAVAGDVAQRRSNTDYLPTYETVMLSSSKEVWADDLRHVNSDFVGKIVARVLLEYLASGEAPAGARNRFILHCRAEMYDEAATYMEGRTQEDLLSEGSSVALFSGVVLQQQGRVQEMRKLLIAWLGKDTPPPDFMHEAAWLFIRAGDEASAVIVLEDLLDHYPDFHRAGESLDGLLNQRKAAI